MTTNVSIVVVGAVLAVACGSSNGTSPSGESTPQNDGGTASETGAPHQDAGTVTEGGPSDAQPEASDHGQPSSNYPAFKPDFAQIQNNGGPVLTAPQIIAITWHADPSEPTYQAFADNIGSTAYWKATTSEYGVGPAVSGATNHVSITTAPPASLADSDLQNMVTTHAGKTAGWPAPNANTIYAFFLPPGTPLQMGAQGGGGGADAGTDACSQGLGGYHNEVTVGSVSTAYAVVPSCTFGSGNTAEQQSTLAMSHELIEATTDPHPNSNPAWVGMDQDHFAFDWFLEFNAEVGDACEVYRESFFEDKETTPMFDDWVQRTWSNLAGPLGHDPCVPAPSEPYFNVAILNIKEVTLSLPPRLTGGSTTQNVQVKGVHIPVGQSATVELGFYSDGPTSGPWTVSWGEGSPFLPTPPTYLNATIDHPTGQNGQIAHATVTPTSAGVLSGELLWFKSTLNGVSHIMPVVVSSYESD
jgi:hypothetical protein